MTPVPKVTVAGLGPADATLIPPLVTERLTTGRWWLRTERHPAATEVRAVGSFDSFYESSDTFDETYRRIAAAVIADANDHGSTGYVVPGSPLVLERTVELLAEAADRGEIALEVLPAMSFLDLAWAALRVDPVTVGVRLVDGHRFAVDAAGERGPLLVAHAHSRQVLSDIKLAALDDAEADPTAEVLVLHHLGLPSERIIATTWAELDREVTPDHLTSLWVQELAVPVAAALQRLAESASGDRVASGGFDPAPPGLGLRTSAVASEEAMAAFDPASGTGADELCTALGAMLGGVTQAARVAERSGWFNLGDVADAALAASGDQGSG
jgi:tetrapyrrole methylase family protein/MazG family protein